MRSNNSLEEKLIAYEGWSNTPYFCPTGYLSVGVGRNLETNPLTDEECMYLLRNDIKRCKLELNQFDWYFNQPEHVQQALLRMNFNLGLTGFLTFKKMIEALKEKDYTKAAIEALDSLWAKQVGDRAKDIALQLRGEHG